MLYRDERSANCVRDPGECRISSTTGAPAHVAPVFDGSGLAVNPNPAATITVYTCTTCNRSWTATSAETPAQRL
jgi:hypothetical protein